MHLRPHLLPATLLFFLSSQALSKSCSGVGYRDVCCSGLIIGTLSNANNLDGLTCCSGDPTHAIQIGLYSCTAGTSVAMTALASVSGGVSAGTTTSTTQPGSGVTGKGPKTSMAGSGSATILTGTSESSTSTMPTVETVGGTSTSGTTSSTAGGAMITQGPLLLVGGAAALFAYGVM